MSRNVVKGVIWSGVEKFSVQISQFVFTIVLARLLSPEDFGIIAITLVLMNILQVFNEVGFGEALIQKLDRDNLDYSSIFFFNFLWGILLYWILYILAPYLAEFFEVSSLLTIARYLGLNIVLNSLIIVQRTILMIKMDFKTQAKASLIGVIFGGLVGVFCAYKGMGAMSIVVQQLLSSLLNVILIWKFSTWTPKFSVSLFRFKVLFNYAYKLILARFVNVLFTEIYSIVIGKFYTPIQLGYYNRAKSFISVSSNNITGLVQRVSTPILCKCQFDNIEMGNTLLKFINKTAFVVFPLLCALFILADPFILIVLGKKWISSAWLLKVLCPIGMIYVISTFNINIFNATGKTNLALQSEIIKKAISLMIILSTITISFKVFILSQIVISLIEVIIDLIYTKRQINLSLKEQFTNIFPILLSSLIMTLIMYLFINMADNNYIKLLLGGISGLLTYSIIAYVFNLSNFKNIIKTKKLW